MSAAAAGGSDAATSARKVCAVIVGDPEVGKTCALLSFVKQNAVIEYSPSSVESYTVKLTTDTGTVKMVLQDTAGSDSFDSIRAHAYAGCDVVIIFFSLVAELTRDRVLTKWYPEAQKYAAGVPLVLVGTFDDMRDAATREASSAHGREVAQQIRATRYYEVVSTLPQLVTPMFCHAAKVGLVAPRQAQDTTTASATDALALLNSPRLTSAAARTTPSSELATPRLLQSGKEGAISTAPPTPSAATSTSPEEKPPSHEQDATPPQQHGAEAPEIKERTKEHEKEQEKTQQEAKSEAGKGPAAIKVPVPTLEAAVAAAEASAALTATKASNSEKELHKAGLHSSGGRRAKRHSAHITRDEVAKLASTGSNSSRQLKEHKEHGSHREAELKHAAVAPDAVASTTELHDVTKVNAGGLDHVLFRVWVYRNVPLKLSAASWGDSTEFYLLRVATKKDKCKLCFLNPKAKKVFALQVTQSALLAVQDSTRFFIVNVEPPLGIGFNTKDESTSFVVEFMKKMYESRNYMGKRRIASAAAPEGSAAAGRRDAVTSPLPASDEYNVYLSLEDRFVRAMQSTEASGGSGSGSGSGTNISASSGSGGENKRHTIFHKKQDVVVLPNSRTTVSHATAAGSGTGTSKPVLRATVSRFVLSDESSSPNRATPRLYSVPLGSTSTCAPSSAAAARTPEPDSPPALTDHERQVLKRLALLKKIDDKFAAAVCKRATKSIELRGARAALMRSRFRERNAEYQAEALREAQEALQQMRDEAADARRSGSFCASYTDILAGSTSSDSTELSLDDLWSDAEEAEQLAAVYGTSTAAVADTRSSKSDDDEQHKGFRSERKRLGKSPDLQSRSLGDIPKHASGTKKARTPTDLTPTGTFTLSALKAVPSANVSSSSSPSGSATPVMFNSLSGTTLVAFAPTTATEAAEAPAVLMPADTGQQQRHHSRHRHGLGRDRRHRSSSASVTLPGVLPRSGSHDAESAAAAAAAATRAALMRSSNGKQSEGASAPATPKSPSLRRHR